MSNNKTGISEEYNEAVRTQGAWIDNDFLHRLLTDNFNQDYEILGYNVEAAVNAGDNYMGTLYRTTVECIEADSDEVMVKKFMIKGLPPGQVYVDMIQDMQIFEKEMFIYNKCLPAMYTIFKEQFSKDIPFVAPRSFKCFRSNTIVMEDLAASHFEMADRRELLNFEQAITLLQAMARFHALSLKALQQNPALADGLNKDFYLDNAGMGRLFFAGPTSFTKVMKTWPECQKYIAMFENLSVAFLNNNLMGKLLERGDLNVITHGDLWTTNCMFHYNDSGIVDEAKIIDYQIARICPPTLDVLYFMFTSIKTDALLNNMTLLWREYYNTFVESLSFLNVQTDYTFSKFNEEIQQRFAFAVWCMIVSKPVHIAEAVADLTGEGGEDANLLNPKYKYSTIVILDHLERVGLLQVVENNVKMFMRSLKMEPAEPEQEKKIQSISPSILDCLFCPICK